MSNLLEFLMSKVDIAQILLVSEAVGPILALFLLLLPYRLDTFARLHCAFYGIVDSKDSP